MKTAPLQLLDYWADFIQVEANPNFDQDKRPDLSHESLQVNHSVHQLQQESDETETGTAWATHLEIIQDISATQNLPYSFTIRMNGIVAAHPKYTDEQLGRIIKANAPAMLFGAAREVLRAATGRGPYPPVIIPSTNFIESEKADKPAKKSTKKTAIKKTTAKKRSSKRAK